VGRAIMVQGTASHVGKSVLTAGLCRLFRQEGLRVAPFKSQNMALNSFVTREGHEIGRAQAVQAEAARVEPTVDMNPILLKPEGNRRSQVVILGRVYGSMDAAEYYQHKTEFWPLVETSLQRLMDAYDVVVVEGAGSPVEVNLKEQDIVNMRVAKHLRAPVILVADIDRGGVFASLVGTMELLEPSERELVAGFIINKFRGDPALFEPGVTFLEQRLGRPVLGVVPWLLDLGLAEEDSQGLPASAQRTLRDVSTESGSLDVVVLRLPHIANFDDFDPFARTPSVRLRYVDRAVDFGQPDLVILPGTKTTLSDLAFLRGQGLDRCVMEHAGQGKMVVGICGGFQMLCERIEDPEGIDGMPGSVLGLGLLPGVTHYETEKATVQVAGRLLARTGPLAVAAGQYITGYEIHMGYTVSSAPPLVQMTSGARMDGAVSADGMVLGTYLHGLFHNSAVLTSFMQALGVPSAPAFAHVDHGPDPYDRLAGELRSALRVEHLIKLVTGR
jgi:adenosylcobyric acid synthase